MAKAMNEKPGLIKLNPAMGTDCKQAKAGQQYRLSDPGPFGVMRQSGLAENEPREGEPKSLPAGRDLGQASNRTTRACSPTPQELERTIECLGNRALLSVPCDKRISDLNTKTRREFTALP